MFLNIRSREHFDWVKQMGARSFIFKRKKTENIYDILRIFSLTSCGYELNENIKLLLTLPQHAKGYLNVVRLFCFQVFQAKSKGNHRTVTNYRSDLPNHLLRTLVKNYSIFNSHKFMIILRKKMFWYEIACFYNSTLHD